MQQVVVSSAQHLDIAWEDWRQGQCQCGGPPPPQIFEANTFTSKMLKTWFKTNKLAVPNSFPELYTETLTEGWVGVYNPMAERGVHVINDSAINLLKLIDGERTLLVIKSLLDWSEELLADGIHKLIEAGLIYFGKIRPDVIIRQSDDFGVWLHVTNECNLKCLYCYIKKSNNTLDLEQGRLAIQRIIESAVQNNHKRVTLKFAGGEPLIVFPLVQQLLSYANELAAQSQIEVVPVLLTNGTLITPAIAKLLKEQNFVVSLSLDGIDLPHNLNRPLLGGQSSFKKVELALGFLQEFDVKLNASVVITKLNLSGLPFLVQYLLGRNIAFTFNFLRPTEFAEDGLTITNLELIEVLNQVCDVIETNLPTFSIHNILLDRVNFIRPRLQACGAGENYLVVKNNGELTGCQLLNSKKSAVVGKIGETKNLLSPIREKHFVPLEVRSIEHKNGCNQCQWRYNCAGGCPLATLAAKGRFDTRSPFCDVYKAIIPRLLRIEALRLQRKNL